MAIDLSRVATKALEAALEDGQQRRRGGSTVRALAAGAALAVGARAAMSKTPRVLEHLPGLSELRDIPDRLRDRMADAGWLDDDQEPVEEEPEAYEDEDEPEDDDVEDEEVDDEDLDDEDVDEDEPEAEADEDFDDEEPDENADDDDEEPAPELELESADDDDLHPEDRPPKPPRSKTEA